VPLRHIGGLGGSVASTQILGMARPLAGNCLSLASANLARPLHAFTPYPDLSLAVWAKRFQIIHHRSVDVAHGLRFSSRPRNNYPAYLFWSAQLGRGVA
jgi:hypothetical protein